MNNIIQKSAKLEILREHIRKEAAIASSRTIAPIYMESGSVYLSGGMLKQIFDILDHMGCDIDTDTVYVHDGEVYVNIIPTRLILEGSVEIPIEEIYRGGSDE